MEPVKRLILGCDSRRVSFVFVFCLLVMAAPAYSDWQGTLESNFDYAETFDTLEDWVGTQQEGIRTKDPGAMPRRSDGMAGSITWDYFKYADSARFPLEHKTIGSHGSKETWQGTGKSLRIDYGHGDFQSDYGPVRFGFVAGNSPGDGYDEVYVFFMQYYPKSFFEIVGGEFKRPSFLFLKTVEIGVGFKNSRHWGTDAEHDWVLNNCASCQNQNQTLLQYGMNGAVFNYQASGGRLFGKFGALVTRERDSSCDKCQYSEVYSKIQPGADLTEPVMNGQWFGVQYRYRLSNPNGAANGEVEMWFYDRDGNMLPNGHSLVTGLVTIRDGQHNFSHKINKFIWGGNRSGNPTYGEFIGCTEYLYLDDIVVHNEPVAEKYFSLLLGLGGAPPVVPNPPINLKLEQ